MASYGFSGPETDVTQMPRRPRQHDLETASLRALMDSLPDQWVAQRRDDDYGIDLDIEVFRDVAATGTIFGVQLKGTENLRGSPTVSIKWSTANYWSAQTNPVLVALWERSTGSLWWHWWHRFDTSRLDRERTTFTFQFPDEQVWDDHTPHLLLAEAEAWRAWGRPYAHLPIEVSVRGTGSVGGVAVGRVVNRVRQRLSDFGDLFSTRGEADGILKVSVDLDSDKCVIWLSGGPSTTLHYESLGPADRSSGQAIEELLSKLSADIVLLIARQLSLLNAMGPAARVVGATAPDSSVVDQPEVALDLLLLLFREHRIQDAIRLLARLILAGHSAAPSIAMLMSDTPLSVEERQELVSGLVRIANIESESNRGRNVGGPLLHNAAQYLRQVEPAAALDLFSQAAALDPGYHERGYWWAQTGGCLFLIEDYGEAVTHYRRAVDLGHTAARPLLADALMFAGRYHEALTLFRESREETVLPQEFRLKERVLEFLIAYTGTESQARNPTAAAAAALARPKPDELRAILDLDMLNPQALSELGFAAAEDGQPSVDFFLAEALADPLHAHSWLRAITAAAAEERDLLADIGSCARRFCGETIFYVLAEEEAPSEVSDFVEALFTEVPPDPPPRMELRQVRWGSPEFTVLDLRSPGEDERPRS